MKFSLVELWATVGGFAKAIVIAMLLMALASLFVTCERLVVFARSRRASRRYAARMAKTFESGQVRSGGQVGLEGNVGHLGRVIEAGIKAFETSPSTDEQFTVDTVARALERQAQREIEQLRRGQGVLGTVSSTAPFVGLLGTVIGIVTAFQQMAATGAGGLATVSAGIAEALVTTAIGLLVAIPAVFAFNFLQGWVDARAVDIAESSNEFLDFVARRLRSRGPAGSKA
jgi:biopolymer transport protein ExbB/biopolymer transport protein TolQ